MKLIEPKVEWWPQDKTIAQHIARVGRICYMSEGIKPSDELTDEQREAFVEERDQRRCAQFWKSGHKSMLRHGTMYYYVPDTKDIPYWIYSYIVTSDYTDVSNLPRHGSKSISMYMSTNKQFVQEHRKISKAMEPFEVTEEEFIAKALKENTLKPLMLLRMTFVVTTQISTSRELNRTSPNAIAEQSTRFVNLDKKGGMLLCRPHWFDTGTWWQRTLFRVGGKVSEWLYTLLLRSGLRPEDARGVLILDTYTTVAYTYSLNEWKHILSLRYYGHTGKPHQNARIAVAPIRDIINERMTRITDEFSI